jgi:hypothetical protein
MRSVVTVFAAAMLAACSAVGGSGQSLTIADKAFLQKFAVLGGKVSGDGAQTDAITVGKAFCGELESGATQAQAHQAVYARYLGVGLADIEKAAAAANLTYCRQAPRPTGGVS